MFGLYEDIFSTLSGKREGPRLPGASAFLLAVFVFFTLSFHSARAANIDIAVPNTSGIYGGVPTIIKGTGFTGVTDVAFGSVTLSRTAWSFVSDTQINATIPASLNQFVGNVDIVVSKGSTELRAPNGFVYTRTDPVITDIQPRQAGVMGGGSITMTGTNFSLPQAVTFNGVAADPASIVLVNATTLKVKVPPSAGNATGPITVNVQTSNGLGSISGLLSYFRQDPSITAISPPSAGINGGATVAISGTNLADTIGVSFGSVAADPASIVQTSASQISVRVPPRGSQSASSVNVSVTTTTGFSSNSAPFSYTVANPTVTGVSPNTSAAFGEITVTINGSGFTNAIGVKFGTVLADASTLTILSDNQISIKVPSSPNLAAGFVGVTVITQTGEQTLAGAYEYTRQDPVINAVTPRSGPIYGGYPITISGVGLTSATQVTVGSTVLTAQNLTVNPDGSLTVNLPMAGVTPIPGTSPVQYFPMTFSGPVSITVTTPNGSKTATNLFNYDTRTDPVIQTITPTSGMEEGGTYVVITGNNFQDLQLVKFAGQAATIVRSTATQIEVTTPTRSPPGTTPVGMTVQTSRGTTTKTAVFMYYPSMPKPKSYVFLGSPVPTFASTNGTTKIQISGNLLDASVVTIGGVTATIVSSSRSSITCYAPVNTPGVKTIVVTTQGGSASPSDTPTILYQAQPAPTVTGPTGSSGSVVGGTQVVIRGTNLQGATVTFDGLPATIVANPSDGLSVTVSTPPHPATGNVPVVVTTPTAVPVTLAGGYTYVLPPTPVISSITPLSISATGGNVVNVTGSNLMGASVTVDGVAVSNLQIVSDTVLTFTAPAHVPGSAVVRVTTPGGRVDSSINYAMPAYFLTGVSPGTDSIAGGATITMTGQNLIGVDVYFDTAQATNVVVAANGSSLTATAPAHAAGPATIWIYKASNGSVGLPNVFSYYTPPPTITAVATPTGNTYGGTTVTITGTNLWNASVLFDTSPATAITVAANGRSLTASAPAHAAGTVNVSVTTPGGTAVSNASFTYVVPPPQPMSKDVAQGSTDGGTVVTISGRYLEGATVDFDGVPATNIVAQPGGFTVVATSPAHIPGVVSVTVTTPGGTATLADRYTYIAPSPLLTHIAPATGRTTGGSTVTLTGRYLWDASVRFGSFPATSVTVASDGLSLTALSPAHGEGQVDVTVSVPGMTDAVLANAFTYLPPVPALGAISPSSGPLSGGTQVTLTGTDFTPATSVTFGTQVLTPAVVAADGLSLKFTLPVATATAVVPVTVTTTGGTSNALNFSYVAVPQISSLGATSGPLGGGSLTVSGSNFGSDAVVNFNGQVITPTTIAGNGASLTITLPTVTAAATLPLTITTTGGTSNALNYTYVALPVLNNLTVQMGSLAGGTSVKAMGSNFTPASRVNFGGQVVIPDSVDASGTFLMFRTPVATAPAVIPVTITTEGGTTTHFENFTYLPPASHIVSLSASSGPLGGGTITVRGTYFVTGVRVFFNGSYITPATVDPSGNWLTFVVPAATAAGTVNVKLLTTGGFSNTVSYTYVAGPFISGLSATSGPLLGGQTVRITGTGLATVTAVNFGTASASFTNVMATALDVTVPAGTGTVSVTVESIGGTSNQVAYTYVAAPQITSLAATSGPEAGGQTVTISGTDLAGITAVRFGTVSASFANGTATSVDVTVPAGTGTAAVTVETIGGTSNGVNYTYVAGPQITGLSVTSGPEAGGQTLTITGAGLAGTTAVKFGTVSATFSNVTATSLDVTIPAGIGAVSVTVETIGGLSNGRTYTYVAAAQIASLSATSGPEAGGQTVTITGQGLAGTTAVRFGTVSATFSNVTATSLDVTIPAGTGTVSVTVETLGGLSNGLAYSYVAAPQITSLSATSGPEAGGQTVTIAGAGLAGITAVKFGTVSAPFTNGTATSVDVTVPAGSGAVSVTVETIGGLSNGLTYTYAAAPQIISLNATSGPEAGGQTVSITGTGLAGITGVKFGAVSASFANNTATSVDVTVPAGTGTVSITVETIGGQSNGVAYAYVAGPQISRLSATSGPLSGGQTITITGTGLAGVTKVMFGSVSAPFANPTASMVDVVVPAGTGTVRVTVETSGGISNSVDYTYVATPQITGLSSTSGPLAGGQTVTITGSDLAAVTSVNFGTAPASFTHVTATSIDATVPAGTGTVSVTVENIAGRSNGIDYTYVATPHIVALSTTSGPEVGGQTVTITGTDLAAVTAVKFGTVSVSFTNATATSIDVTVPAGTGTVSVTVENIAGKSNGIDYTYLAGPAIVSLSPSTGATAGNFELLISGTGLAHAPVVVKIDGIAHAPAASAPDGSWLRVSMPSHAAGNVPVSVETALGTASAAGGFTYVDAPAITAITPATSPIQGGGNAEITGQNFTSGMRVWIGGVLAPVIKVSTPGSVTVKIPAHRGGAAKVAVKVSTAGGDAELPQAFAYLDSLTMVPSGGGLKDALSCKPYSQAIGVANGSGPVRFTVVSGALPPGLKLDAAKGSISGPVSAKANGRYTFAVKATEQSGRSAAASYAISVKPCSFVIPTRTITFGPDEIPVSVSLTQGVSGGPFISAIVVSVDPVTAGKAVILPTPSPHARPDTPAQASLTRTQSANANLLKNFQLKFVPTPGYEGKAVVRYEIKSNSGGTGQGIITYIYALDRDTLSASAAQAVQSFVDHRQSLLAEALETPSLMDRRDVHIEKTGRVRLDPSASGLRGGFDMVRSVGEAADGDGSPVTAWAKARADLFQRSDKEATGKPSDWGNFALFSAGVDYRVSDRLLAGVTFDFHRMSDPTDASTLVSGNGWLAGPYGSFRLFENVYLDGSLLYGQSTNALSSDQMTGAFDTHMLLAHLVMRGEERIGGLTVSPSLKVDFIKETIDSFTVNATDGQAVSVPGFDRTQLRGSIAVDVSKDIQVLGGFFLTPSLGLSAGFAGLDGKGFFGGANAAVRLTTKTGWQFNSAVKLQLLAGGLEGIGFQGGVTRQF